MEPWKNYIKFAQPGKLC